MMLQVNKSLLRKLNATEMTLALEAIQTNAQRVASRKYKIILKPNYRAESEEQKKKT